LGKQSSSDLDLAGLTPVQAKKSAAITTLRSSNRYNKIV
jgi:hypothetical protein